MKQLSKTYDPKDFEGRIYKYWMDEGYFRPEVDKSKKPFTIVMPPPNVTGNLHMGHALNNTIQDIIIRFKRMQGYSALWLPGTDHASISTEAKVVGKLKADGKTKEDVGRDGFLEEAWEWTRIYGGNIKNQLKELGVSCDWSRDRFTLDEMLSNAVMEVFIRLYDKKLIYRGDRIINWCPNCGTAISDAEVEHEETDGFIYNLKYPLEGGGFIEIATTRPETIPGDLAIAVHPEDDRYTDLVGRYAILPIMDRRIPIIADEYVERDFGSGAVKITPSHDPNDFEVGERHGLGQCKVIDDEAKLNENAGKYKGMDRYEARKQIVEDFKKLGLLVSIENHHNAVGHCERCHTVIEPIISKQWFVKMKPLVEPAIEAFKKGEPEFIPDRFGKVYLNWLENIKDWCISRQLWWGHRLPVYYCNETGEVVVSKTDPTGTKGYEGKTFKQDEDTLDTWFSSALWPFSTLGWPEETEDFKYFFPTDVLITGYDIIFFWVIRMVFSSLEQTGKMPFKHVFFTGLVRDSQGRKMSKSLGNGVDPLDIIEKYGADALRFTLITGNSPGNDMRYYDERVEANRNFANKLWNATRFVLMNINEKEDFSIDISKLKNEDKWILSRLEEVIEEVTRKLDQYEIGIAAEDIYDFIWSDYCDWYIEMVKPRLYGDDADNANSAKAVLLYVLKRTLEILHPFMPFITEEIYSHLPGVDKALIIADWPKVKDEYRFEKEEKNIEYIKVAIKEIRNARSQMDIGNDKRSNTIIYTKSEEVKNIISENKDKFLNLGFSNNVTIVETMEDIGDDNISIVLDRSEIFLPLRELVDYNKELDRLSKEREDIVSELKRAKGKLSNESFVSKAPEKIVNAEREKIVKYEKMLINIEERIRTTKEKLK
ncbi:valine--tRNA ligase [Peptoniphilus catoniae]|uniref:valine--tRNA ligase n=1 Tax=Peptoniphilus catoniae TaxID=1660341 RepID=UPI0010FF25A1|nr:valine--tRNA ligase [Peptoniphilus catoniae]